MNNELTELWYGLYQQVGTNNTAELHGLKQAFILAKEKLKAGLSVAIYCDSKYSIDCITKWATGWEKKGWTKSGGEIKNLDIIKPAYALYQELASQITIYHVNGHVGIEGNELADRMSIVAIASKGWGKRAGIADEIAGKVATQPITVVGNGKEVELIVNGKSLGKKTLDFSTVTFNVPFKDIVNQKKAACTFYTLKFKPAERPKFVND